MDKNGTKGRMKQGIRLLYGIEIGCLVLLPAALTLCWQKRINWRVCWSLGAAAVLCGCAATFIESYRGVYRKYHAVLTGMGYGVLLTVPVWGNYRGWLWLQVCCTAVVCGGIFYLLYRENRRRCRIISEEKSSPEARREAEGRAHASWAMAAVLAAALLAMGVRAKPVNKDEAMSSEKQYRLEVQQALADYAGQVSVCQEERGIYLNEEAAETYGIVHRFVYRDEDEHLAVNVTNRGSEEERETADVPEAAAFVWNADYTKGDVHWKNVAGEWREADGTEGKGGEEYGVRVNEIGAGTPDVNLADKVEKEITETGAFRYTLTMGKSFREEQRLTYPEDSVWCKHDIQEAVYLLDVDENGHLMRLEYRERGSNPELAVGYTISLITRICILDQKRVQDEIEKQLEEVYVPVY